MHTPVATRMSAVFLILASLALTACAGNPAPSGGPVPAVAVFGFEVKSADPAHSALGQDIAQAITEAFIKGKRLRPVERTDLARILEEQEFSVSGLVREEDAIRAGKLAGARYILLGTVTVLDARVRMNARLIDVESAEIVVAESVTGTLDRMFSLEEDLARKVEAAL